MRGVSVELLPDPPAAEVIAAVCAADETGLHTVFLADEIYHRDAWLILAAAAPRTSRIRLAAGVAHVTLRDPLLAAQHLATLDELTQGRAAAAFSVGNLAMLEQFGVDPAELHVAPRLREAHTAMRSLLDSGRVDLDGRFHRYRGVFTSARPAAAHVPLLLGAMGGPLTFRLAGEIADGVYAACSFSPEAFEYLIANVRRGAERAGRDWRDLELCASLTAAVSEDGESARAAARFKAAFYLPSMPPGLIERHGVPYAEVQPICEAFASGDVRAALERTPDDLADRFCIAGTPEEIVDRLRKDVLPSGIDHVVLALTDRRLAQDWAGIDLPGLPPLDEQIRLIGTRIAPALMAR
jgi:alkanesulfonate monooxygenase SsuD/methylene tetrahydromethanopterin reductase-like flavin-dependent oxidoreductase (luciferase family)